MIPRILTKKIETAIDKITNPPKKRISISIILSIIALTVSLFTLYRQYFFKDTHIMVSLILDPNHTDSSITYKILYNNMGNRNTVITFQGFTYTNPKFDSLNKDLKLEYDNTIPIIVSGDNPYLFIPANQQQIYSVTLSFKPKIDLSMDTIHLTDHIDYLSADGKTLSTTLYLGWVLFNKDGHIIDHRENLIPKDLDKNEVTFFPAK